MKSSIKRFIGTKGFYAAVIALIVPITVQQGITQFVNLLDNVMVGQLGTVPMSGVSIVNRIVFIFNLTIFGGMSGASIFGTQYYGKEDFEGLRNTLRFRLYFGVIASAVGILVIKLFGEQFFLLFLQSGANSQAEVAETLLHAGAYTRIIVWGLLPFAIASCFSSVLRETGETVIPMAASVISILVNLVFNWLLIFGNLGFPKMGVAGAALATVIARYVEMLYLIVILFWKSRSGKLSFLKGAFRSLRVPAPLVKRIAVTGTPLMLNEALWSIGTSMVQVCYATRGLEAVAAVNINYTAFDLFSLAMMAMGNAVAILVGQKLGANDIDGAKDVMGKLIAFAVTLNAVMGVILIGFSPLIPQIYNTEDAVRHLAAQLLMISGGFLPFTTFVHCTYFTIRSGGRTFITFLFDCVYTWVIVFPVAYLLSRFTALSLPWMFFFVQCADTLFKGAIGVVMLKSGIWAKNLVASEK